MIDYREKKLIYHASFTSKIYIFDLPRKYYYINFW